MSRRRKVAPREDLTGIVSGHLTVLCTTEDEKGHTRWMALCDCGSYALLRPIDLKKVPPQRYCTNACPMVPHPGNNRTHGMSGTKIYWVWSAMLERCRNPLVKNYHNYGGRGIKVCDRWYSFEKFYEDMGDTYQEGLTIDRLDVDRDYEPSNCAWVPDVVNKRNRRNTFKYRLEDVPDDYLEQAEAAGIKHPTLMYRLRTGWSWKEAISTKDGRLSRGPQLRRKRK
jgi:hypothetical protein